jgi:hypothetical protein
MKKKKKVAGTESAQFSIQLHDGFDFQLSNGELVTWHWRLLFLFFSFFFPLAFFFFFFFFLICSHKDRRRKDSNL